jgi:hypothetical protein
MLQVPRLKCCRAMRRHQREAKNDHDNGLFVRNEADWNVNGCCGGGCYVVQDIRHCPFCGANLPTQA